MLSLLRRYSVRLMALIATVILVPQLASIITVEQVFSRLSSSQINSELKIAASAADIQIQSRFGELKALALTLGEQISSIDESGRIFALRVHDLFGAFQKKKSLELAIFFNESGGITAQIGNLPNVDFSKLLASELRDPSQPNIVNGALNLDRIVCLYSLLPLPEEPHRGWLFVGQILDQAELQNIANDLHFGLSFIRYRANESNAWQILTSTHSEKERIEILNILGKGRNDGMPFSYDWNKLVIGAFARRLHVNAQKSDLGILVDRDFESTKNLLSEMRENQVMVLMLAIALGAVGAFVLQRRQTSGISAAAATIQSVLGGEVPDPLEVENDYSLAEINQSVNDLVAKYNEIQNEKNNSNMELEGKIYELERAVFESNLVNKVYKETNYQIGLFEVMNRATDIILNTYGISHAFLFRKSGMDELTTIFVKKRIKHSGQIITSKELVPLFHSLDDAAQQCVETEARNSLASGRLHRTELPMESGAMKQVVAIPFSILEGMHGALCLIAEHGEYFFTDNETPFLESLGMEFSEILDLARINDTSVLDSLTRLYNYRHFQTQLAIEAHRARRNNTVLSLLTVEIDDFKQFSARQEYKVAEDITRDFASLLRTICRSTDIICRKDGALFMLLLPETPAEGAAIVAEKIRQGAENNVTNLSRGPIRFTVSIGAALFPSHVVIPKDLINLALEAMENAKSLGGNRCSILKTTPEKPAPAGDLALETAPTVDKT